MLGVRKIELKLPSKDRFSTVINMPTGFSIFLAGDIVVVSHHETLRLVSIPLQKHILVAGVPVRIGVYSLKALDS